MGRISRIAVILLITAGIVASWAYATGFFKPKPYKETQFYMDTIIEITAYGPHAEEGVKAAFAEFKQLHGLTNNFDPDSQISLINQMAGREKVPVDPDMVFMINRANELADRLDGTFDVAIGPLTDLWGIGRKGDYVPGPAEIAAALRLVNYHKVKVDAGENTVYLEEPGMKLDMGGIAKGYATDRAIEALKAKGVTAALVNAGGDVRVIGKRPDGQPWRIGVQDPRNPDGIIAKLSLTDWDTMETSGDYQRFIEKDGVRYSHIIDPRTGWQPRQITSVTMVLNSSVDGDILSTAIFVLGVDRGRELLRQFPGVEAIIMTKDGELVLTPGLEGKVEKETSGG